MTLVAEDLIVGVDTRKDVHVAVVLDRLGHRLAVRDFAAADAGNVQMTGWLAGLGTAGDAGVEGTGSCGYRLAQLLAGRGIQVWEVNCPDRSRRRRRRGKSDPADAENAARGTGRRGDRDPQGPGRVRRRAATAAADQAQRGQGPHSGVQPDEDVPAGRRR